MSCGFEHLRKWLFAPSLRPLPTRSLVQVSFGALGDSYYEYLLKLWVLKGRPQGDFLREMWEQVGMEVGSRCESPWHMKVWCRWAGPSLMFVRPLLQWLGFFATSCVPRG